MGFYSVSKGCVGLEWLEMSSIGLLWVLCFYVAFDEDIDICFMDMTTACEETS